MPGGSDTSFMTGLPAAPQSSSDLPGLYQMAMNPATGGAYDPLGLLMNGPQFHEMFDPSGEEDRLRTASVAGAGPFGGGGDARGGAAGGGSGARLAPWINQPLQGQQAQDMDFRGITAGAAPKYSETGSENVFPSLFNLRAPRSGWFNLQDYYKGAPTEDRQGVPGVFQTGSNALSTNDWRLLPPQYRSPNYFMINGNIIDRGQASIELSPFGHGSQLGAESGVLSADVNRASLGVGGHPRVYWSGWDATSGYPGQQSPRSHWATTNY